MKYSDTLYKVKASKFEFRVTSIPDDYVAVEPTKKKKKEIPSHIANLVFSFNLSLLRSSEMFWFWRDNGTTVLGKFALDRNRIFNLVRD